MKQSTKEAALSRREENQETAERSSVDWNEPAPFGSHNTKKGKHLPAGRVVYCHGS